jgi:hypothetical protein
MHSLCNTTVIRVKQHNESQRRRKQPKREEDSADDEPTDTTLSNPTQPPSLPAASRLR